MSTTQDMGAEWVPSLDALTGGGDVPVWSMSDRMRKAREWRGLDQTTLARFVGVTRATISALENGHRKPANATIRLWAASTNVSLSWLETGMAPSPDGDGASVARPEGFEPPTFCTVVPLRAVA